jgi:hypothetical protein
VGELNLDKMERAYSGITDVKYIRRGNKTVRYSAWKMLTRNDEIRFRELSDLVGKIPVKDFS